jgi:hypothetical protein
MKNKSIQFLMFGILTSVVVASHGVVSYAQTNSSMPTIGTNTSSSSINSTTNNSTAIVSDNPVVQSIEKAIKAIRDGDNKSGKKSLLEAEEALEGKSDLVDAEKRVEAALAALKDGDNNGAISHAEEAMKKIS